MTYGFKLVIVLCIASFLLLWWAGRVNKPYPWNSNIIDYCEGVGVITFVPTFLYVVAKGVWLL